MNPETFTEKFKRKAKAQPLVPLGALGTLFCLASGLNQFRQANARKSQLWMRARCLAQAFTVVCMGVGFYQLSLENPKPAQGEVDMVYKQIIEQAGKYQAN